MALVEPGAGPVSMGLAGGPALRSLCSVEAAAAAVAPANLERYHLIGGCALSPLQGGPGLLGGK